MEPWIIDASADPDIALRVRQTARGGSDPGSDLPDALQAGDVKTEGQIAAAERYVTLFPLPEPATPGSVLAVEGAP